MTRSAWTAEQLKLAFHLYCQLPFGRLSRGNPEVIALANLIGWTPSAVALKLTNLNSRHNSSRNFVLLFSFCRCDREAVYRPDFSRQRGGEGLA